MRRSAIVPFILPSSRLAEVLMKAALTIAIMTSPGAMKSASAAPPAPRTSPPKAIVNTARYNTAVTIGANTVKPGILRTRRISLRNSVHAPYQLACSTGRWRGVTAKAVEGRECSVTGRAP